MRLFIAAAVPAETRASLRQTVPFYQDQIDHAVPESNWHLTFFWLGDVADPEAVLALLPPALPHMFRPAALLTHVGPGRAAGQLWAYSKPTSALNSIREELRALVNGAGDDRAFVPHIKLATLAEAKRGELLADQPLQATLPLTALQVYRSDLTPTGPQYAVLKTIALTS